MEEVYNKADDLDNNKPEDLANLKERVRLVNDDQKIDVEIRDIIRIKPQDFSALKSSFEAWAKEWD